MTSRSKPWVMRTYSGHSSAVASNELYRSNLAKGQTGLSIAFDLPTQTGYDPDDPAAAGEVGKVGVPIAHLGHMRQLFDALPLAEMNTSMTINATAPWLFALYVALAEERGVPIVKLSGTTQNDIVKEYLARGTFIFPPRHSMRLTCDLVTYAVEHVPAWNPINVCSYHLQEAGATPVQELAYAIAIAIAVLALNLVLLLSPPMQLTDLFNYLGYARLGALHHLNPYTHTIRQELFDPVYGFSSWHNLRSPYGPLFTALTYPLAFLPLPVAYWLVKLATVALSLSLSALVWQCARQLGRDPRFAVAFVSLNPIFLVYAVEGFHNDFFMLVPMLGAISLLLARRDRSAGAMIMVAIAIKFTAVLLLPFLLVAARSKPRRIGLVIGAAVAAIPLIALDLALFGLALPNLSQQSTLLTGFSIPNVFGLLLDGGGGTPALLKIAAQRHFTLPWRAWLMSPAPALAATENALVPMARWALGTPTR